MTVAQEAIESFRSYRNRVPLDVYNKPIDELINYIEKSTAPYKPKTVPRPYQLEALAFAIAAKKCLIFMKMRLGKSLTSLQYAEQIRKGGQWKRKGLVIVPSPVLLGVWEQQTEQHSHLTITAVHKGLESLNAALADDSDLIVVPWTSLQVMFAKKGFKPARRGKEPKRGYIVDVEALRVFATHFDFMIIDEIHQCKNAGTMRFQMGEVLTANLTYFMGLTGTPMGRDPYDVWGQAYLCDQGRTFGRNYYFFCQAFGKRKYNPFTPQGFEWIFDKKLMPIFEKKLSAISLSYGWEGNLDIPEIISNVVKLNMSGEQLEIYQNCIKKFVQTQQSGRIELTDIFVRLRQISSGFFPFVGDESDEQRILKIKNPVKLAWMTDLLNNVPPEMRIVIFHEFTISGQLISDHLKTLKRPHSWLYGKTKDKPGELRKFQTGKVNVLLANTKSGGVGIDLSMADYMCFLESPTSPTVRAQAEARPISVKRRHNILTVDDVICSPIEERILGFIREGKDMLKQAVFRGEIDKFMEGLNV